MSSRLDALFAEDVQMQDDLEEMSMVSDFGEDIILGVINDRANAREALETHLFTNESCDETVNDDGLTEEEEREVQMALLNGDEDFDDELLDDEDIIDLAATN